MPENTKKQLKAYPLRMAEDLKKWVKNRAMNNDRSINAELNRILKSAKEQEETTQTEDTK